MRAPEQAFSACLSVCPSRLANSPPCHLPHPRLQTRRRGSVQAFFDLSSRFLTPSLSCAQDRQKSAQLLILLLASFCSFGARWSAARRLARACAASMSPSPSSANMPSRAPKRAASPCPPRGRLLAQLASWPPPPRGPRPPSTPTGSGAHRRWRPAYHRRTACAARRSSARRAHAAPRGPPHPRLIGRITGGPVGSPDSMAGAPVFCTRCSRLVIYVSTIFKQRHKITAQPRAGREVAQSEMPPRFRIYIVTCTIRRPRRRGAA